MKPSKQIIKRNQKILKAFVLAGFISILFTLPVFAEFVDSFEGSSLDPFWTTYISSGSITFPSTATVHSGTQSVQLNSVQDGGQKNVQFSHNFTTPVYGTFSIWFYDTGADESSSNYGTFYVAPEVATPDGWGAKISTQDYDLGPTNGGNYYATYGQGEFNTGIDRTKAWHLFAIEALPDGLTLSIDQQIVYSGTGIGRINSVNFSMFAPSWRPAWTSYFDDFTYIPFGFMDGFEDSALDPYWTTYTSSGSITFPSTAKVHSGTQSVQLNSVPSGGQKNVQFSHYFDTPVYGTFSIWFYDTGADVSSSNYGMFMAAPEVATPDGWGAYIATQDYDLGPSDGGCYYAGHGQGPVNTGIDRTKAWHLFTIEALPESLTLSIDQQVVYSGAGIGRINSINFLMYAPSWRPAWTSYFDDFAYVPYVPFAYSGGSGTEADPYLIKTPRDLNAIGLHPAHWSSYFKLAADIDMSQYSGTQYNIIGNQTQKFSGTFDGNHHVIRNLSYTTANAVNYAGLFGWAWNAHIRNVGLEDVLISTGGYSVGGLAGETYLGCTVSSCYVTGSVDGNQIVGGLVGVNSGAITSCYSTAAVSGADPHVGGLVGANYNPATIANSYATGAVLGNNRVGGLAGYNHNASVTNCYSTGSVNGVSEVGGLVGTSMGTHTVCVPRCETFCMPIFEWVCDEWGCYEIYMGEVCRDECWDDCSEQLTEDPTLIVTSFWDTQSSGQNNSAGGVGKKTSEMKTIATFAGAGWDFARMWGIGERQTYPFLLSGSAGDINRDKKVDLTDLSLLAESWLASE